MLTFSFWETSPVTDKKLAFWLWRFCALSWCLISWTSTECVFTFFFGGPAVNTLAFGLSLRPWPFRLTSGIVFNGSISASWKNLKINISDYPNIPIPLPMLLHFILIILPHVTLSAFILISSFKCFSIVPDFYMCSCLPFHMLSSFFPCAQTLFTTFSELLWHFIFLWLSFVTLPTYPNAVYKPMYLPSSSSVCKLTLIPLLSYLLSKSPLSSQVSLFSLITLLVLW